MPIHLRYCSLSGENRARRRGRSCRMTQAIHTRTCTLDFVYPWCIPDMHYNQSGNNELYIPLSTSSPGLDVIKALAINSDDFIATDDVLITRVPRLTVSYAVDQSYVIWTSFNIVSFFDELLKVNCLSSQNPWLRLLDTLLLSTNTLWRRSGGGVCDSHRRSHWCTGRR